MISLARELVPCFARLESTSGRLPPLSPFIRNTPPDPLPQFFFGSDASNLYQYFNAGSLYVHTEFTDTIPTAHVHTLAPAIEYNPTGHKRHIFALLAPVTPEYEPAGHNTHALALVAPVRFEYVPAEQFTHKLPDKYAPALHLQSEIDFDANSEVENCGHDEHCVVCENIRTSFR